MNERPPTKQVAVIWRDGRPTEVHHFKTPGIGSKGFYREGISVDAYSSREAKRFYELMNIKRKGHPPIRAHVMRHVEFIDAMKGFEDFCNSDKALPTLRGSKHFFRALPEFFHESVWEYYKAVGYDYKRQRYDLKTAS